MRFRFSYSAILSFYVTLLACLLAATSGHAQTTQPFVFAGATLKNGPAIAVFTRNDVTGGLTPVSNSPFPVRDAADSFAMDAQGRFLFGSCNNRVCMYLLDKDAGAVQEVPNSPFNSSSTTNPIFIAPESTGQYLYVVNGVFTPTGSSPSPGCVDVFQIDPLHLALLPNQNISSTDYVIDAAMDPRTSALYLFLGMDPATGLSSNPSQLPPPALVTATPAIQPLGGTFSSAQSVTMSDSTAGATIHYTMDGSTPSTNSPVYATPLPLSAAATIQAIATAPNSSPSVVAGAAFKFQTPTGSSVVTITPTATATGSTKSLELSPIQLTLNVQ
jgi:hypothetical protein